ncbi:hypothetical protein [Halostagnicola sp. A-GB9-2]|uniref:hypothetical protein n=1 Tax=Halostagnicola sp. A-GB9-2 TaxID=3048066 RepID=UPI0024BF5A41|nr:hypothetical protein [Halostagnicola sp. A-GB9-2]MDJ1431551.1 hypothetical protein [Halostagnicola sp. A-GB9-2]
MALSDSQEAVLGNLVTNIPNDVTWYVIGSIDSVLRGLEDDPNDIDILTTDSGAEWLRDACSDEFVRTRDVGDSQIDEYRIHGEELEVVFADHGNDHHEPLVDFHDIEMESAAEPAVPLLPLEELLCVYRQIDKHETADRLEVEFEPTDDC